MGSTTYRIVSQDSARPIPLKNLTGCGTCRELSTRHGMGRFDGDDCQTRISSRDDASTDSGIPGLPQIMFDEALVEHSAQPRRSG